MHLEEDPAAWDPETGCVDYNRSGAPLIEIVTEPDFTSAEQVKNWLKRFMLIMGYIKALNKTAGIKADVNVNIKGISTRTEVKNVNSISEIIKVIEYEEKRHLKEKPKFQETRRWNSEKQISESMREKESHADYRFISDPDLPAIKIKKEDVELLKKRLPETPDEKLAKLIKKYKINKTNAEVLSSNLEIVEFFEEIAEKIPPEFALPWVTIELLRVLNYNKKTLDEVKILPEHFIELLNLVKHGKITELKAKQILNNFIPESFSLLKEEKESSKLSEKETEEIVKKAIKENFKAVQDYKSGKLESFNFLMGEVMKLSNKRADYKSASEILRRLIK